MADMTEFETLWDTMQLAARTMTLGATQTMQPSNAMLHEDSGSRPALPRLLSTGRNVSQLEIVSEIGRGGMGVVRLARQIALSREVAVKQVRDDRRSAKSARELTVEGMLLGSLEHPNIVPVYLLGEDDDGFPTLVMKRVDGESWLEVMHHDSDLGPSRSEEELEWHVDVLMQVANAVHFAHSRGILHRDLKPENVMVGEFGEVYVLDWGIAVSLDDARDNLFPRASDVDEVAGTPAYMAPEMVAADASRLGPSTDVYLLGAVLHEIITGSVRHSGDKIFDVLRSAYESEPQEYEGVPAELGRICNRACAPKPEDRYQTAEEFRRALAAYLRHRESIQLAEEAEENAAKLERLIEADSDTESIYSHFQSSLFSFDAAIGAWHENENAIVGRQRLLRRMFEHEIDAEDERASRRILGMLDNVSAEEIRMVERLERLAVERSEAAEALEAVKYDRNLAVRGKWRALIHFDIGVFWFVAAIIFFISGEVASHWWMVASSAAGAFFGALLLMWKREIFMPNEVGRQMLYGYSVSVVMLMVSHLIIDLSGAPIWLAFVFDSLLFAAVSSVMGIALEPRLGLAGLAFVCIAIIAAIFRENAFYVVALGVGIVQVFIAASDWYVTHLRSLASTSKEH